MVENMLCKIVAMAEAVAEWCSEMLRRREGQETREERALRRERQKEEWLRQLRDGHFGQAEEHLAAQQWGSADPVTLPYCVVWNGPNQPYVFVAAFARECDASDLTARLRRVTGDESYEATQGRFVKG